MTNGTFPLHINTTVVREQVLQLPVGMCLWSERVVCSHIPCMSKGPCRLTGNCEGFRKDWSCCRQKPPYSLHTLHPPHAPRCPLAHKHSMMKWKPPITVRSYKKASFHLSFREEKYVCTTVNTQSSEHKDSSVSVTLTSVLFKYWTFQVWIVNFDAWW